MIRGAIIRVAGVSAVLTVDGKEIEMLKLWKGENATLRLVVTNADKSRCDLTGAAISLKVRRFAGDVQAAVLTKTEAAGITILDQLVADTKGLADVAIAAVDIAGIAAGAYALDVLVTKAGVPTLVVKPMLVQVAASVQ